MLAPDPEVVGFIREWLRKGENDLTTAVQILQLGRQSPTDYEPTPLVKAQAAVKIGRRVRRQVRRLLSKEALRTE
jgi:hypothetical protein